MSENNGQHEDLSSILKDLLHVTNVHHQEQISILRTPSPIKIVQTFIADEHGCIGNGLDSPNPVTIWECPMSAEAWLHRITISSPEYHPAQPLQTGEAYLLGSTGQLITWLPHRGDIAPVQLLEGSASAPHLSPGERIQIVADLLPVGISLRVDMQIVLQTGLSQYTPKSGAPGKVETIGVPS